MCSPRSIVPWVDHIVESWWNLKKLLSHIFQKLERDLENPAPKVAHRWKSAVWLGKSDLTDDHLVRTDDGVVYARSVQPLAEHSWSEENLRSVVETPQKPRSTATDDSADPIEQYQKYVNMTTRTSKRTRTTVRTRSLQTSQRTTTMACEGRCFRRLKQIQRQARDEERSVQKHKKMCFRRNGR